MNQEVSETTETGSKRKWKISELSVMTGICLFLCVLPMWISATEWITGGYINWKYDLGGEEFFQSFRSYYVRTYWYSMVCILGGIAMICGLLHLLKWTHQGPHKIEDRRTWVRIHWLPVSLSALLFWSVCSTLNADDKMLAYLGNDYCREGLITFFIYAAFFVIASLITPKQMKLAAEVLVATCAATGILIVARDTWLCDIFYIQTDPRAAMFHNNNHYGYFLAVCLPLSFGLALQDQSNRLLHKALRLLELWLIFNAMAFNSVRGSFIAIVCVLLCWNIYVLTLKRELWKRLLVLDALFVGTLLFLNTGCIIFERLGTLQQELIDLHQTTDAAQKEAIQNDLGSGRGEIWKCGIQFALEKPLFGYGPDNLREPYVRMKIENIRPHNDLILIASTMGFPALFFYLNGLAGHLVNFLRGIKTMSVLEISIFAAVGSYLISSMTGNSFYYTTPYFYLMLGFSYQICRRRIQEKKQAEAAE